MSLQSPKLHTLEEAITIRQSWANERVIFTNGCFDILHPGHIDYLTAAKKLGDKLIIGVNSDASVRGNKGPHRPILDQDQRAYMLAALACVDLVVIFEENTPIALIKALRPDIHIKGGDYSIENLPETPVVRSYGGAVKILPFLPGYSTTQIIEKIQSLE